MPASMLQSQLRTMQVPALEPDVLWLDLQLPLSDQLKRIGIALGMAEQLNDCANKITEI